MQILFVESVQITLSIHSNLYKANNEINRFETIILFSDTNTAMSVNMLIRLFLNWIRQQNLLQYNSFM